TRAVLLLSLAVLATLALAGVTISPFGIAAGGVFTLLFTGVGRSWYRMWLDGRRRQGDFRRPVLLVGGNEEAAGLRSLLDTHPELGFLVVGVVGGRAETGRSGLSRLRCGDYDEVVDVFRNTRATGAIVCATALEPAQLTATVQRLLAVGAHVQLSSGLRGFMVQRLRPMPLSYEPLFYVEPASLERWQFALKRTLDLVLATAVLMVTAPLLALVALLILVADGRPVIFRQERIGYRGQRFVVYKLRTMRVGAESERDHLGGLNAREGPLFKAHIDPRVTRIGRYLRSTGIDELPQLWNVLNGTMSLVGPRPALPEEVAQFDDELRMRESVRPGITGLWQVEARDNPSFDEYRRFDLFYIENWSVALDFVILGTTIEATLARTLRGFRDTRHDVQLSPVLAERAAPTWASDGAASVG